VRPRLTGAATLLRGAASPRIADDAKEHRGAIRPDRALRPPGRRRRGDDARRSRRESGPV